jgi:hypothetical protein
MNDEKLTHKEKREVLKSLSAAAKELVKIGAFDTVNEAIIETIYKNDGHTVFNTFYGWKEQGFNIKKGSTAFVVWGRPKTIKKSEVQEGEKDEFSHFPLAYLFSNLQVEPQEHKQVA